MLNGVVGCVDRHTTTMMMILSRRNPVRRQGTTLLLLVVVVVSLASAFTPASSVRRHGDALAAENEWAGEVVPGGDRIQGCRIEKVGMTEWVVHIDGVEADLAGFSTAIYKKLMADAKQQRFQGFRPGTIPPHIEPTYRAFCMDECARETALEALEQNGVKPFERCRAEMEIDSVSIPPPPARKRKKKSKKRRKQEEETPQDQQQQQQPEEVPEWRTFPSMKEAISGGWKPGQSFSFRASKAHGQKLETQTGEKVSLFGKEGGP